MLTFSDIQIEEVAVKNGLNAAGDDCYEVEEPFHVVAVDPVENVQCSVDAERKQIMTGNGLRLASLTYHEQLRKNCY